MIISDARQHERTALLGLAVPTGLFASDVAEALLGGVLDALAAAELPKGHAAVTCRPSNDSAAIGWSYYAPDAYADKVWNIWWIGVDPNHHGGGAGRALLSHIEHAVAAAGGRVIVIETSDGPALARARRFYASRGYQERGRIPDFYAEGEAKVIFSRTLAAPV